MQPSILKWTIQFNFMVTVFLSLPVSMVISENPSRDGRLWKETLDGDSIRDHGVPVTMVSGDGKAFTGRIITSGIVQDRNLANVSTREVAWFIGIPYAKPPVGDLRFQSPRPLEEDENTNTEFMEFKPSCQQQLSYSFTADMSEDCLYLNVYAPVMVGELAYVTKKSKELYPVMVFIHGGSYRVGGGRLYSGAVLAQRGIIVITFNYRLGVLGFLCGTGEIKGNFGLEDQVEVLHWVQKNIRAFGGDSKKVTIFGNSAGASSVGLLNISLRTKGLFRTAVIQSGSPNAYWAAYRNTDTNILKDYLNLMDCRGNRTLKCLRKARIEDLIAKEYQVYNKWFH